MYRFHIGNHQVLIPDYNSTFVTFETESATWIQTTPLGKHAGLFEALRAFIEHRIAPSFAAM
jgi:hypothetical protein